MSPEVAVRQCNKCWETKPISEFNQGPKERLTGGISQRCLSCEKAVGIERIFEARARRQQRADEDLRKKIRKPRKRRRKESQARRAHRVYNIPPYELIKKRDDQGGRCAICRRKGKPTIGSKGRRKDGLQLHIDHCHKTQHFRGLLCMNCNTGVGQFKDNPDLLRAAADYLERNRAEYAARVEATRAAIARDEELKRQPQPSPEVCEG